MQIRLRLELDCSPDVAWRAIRSPRAAAELYAPLLALAPAQGAQPFPEHWSEGDDVEAQVRVFGLVGLGSQRIAIRLGRVYLPGGGIAPALHDAGRPLTGPLALLDSWDHRMAIEPIPADPTRCLWHDRLVVHGAAANVLGPLLRVVWCLRGFRLPALARTWR